MAQQQLIKDDLIAQFEEERRLKQVYKQAEREWVKYCSEMKPPMEMVKYIVEGVKKNPNNENEKKWLAQVGLNETDIAFTGSSCGSSASTIMSSAHRQYIMTQIPSQPPTPTRSHTPISGQSFSQQQYPSQGFSQSSYPIAHGGQQGGNSGPIPMVVDADQRSYVQQPRGQGDMILQALEGINTKIDELKDEISEVKNRQDRIEGL